MSAPADAPSGAPAAGRSAVVVRETKETQVRVRLGLDGSGRGDIETPLPFFNHMLEALAKHGLFDLEVRARGDVEVDAHHTVEDVGIVLGQAVLNALGDRRGIVRYGEATIPMDETLAQCVIDLSGRSAFVWQVAGLAGKWVGGFDCELAQQFFAAFAENARCNLHLRLHYGENAHHIIEALFKALARACAAAVRLDPRRTDVPSTKGTLTR
ncbi:MAG TPA: imidazoleglycerol-phosphate dehydratase HisB [Polyangia bacterium]|nr:imidazoleglycerol-phosphate dehydratase HisB [Polyangia bacterium]